MRSVLLVLAVFLLGALAGCSAKKEEPPAGQDWTFADARDRTNDDSMGDTSTVKRFAVPTGARDLVIKMRYRIQGEATFQAFDPKGKSYDPTTIEGIGNKQDERWVAEASPVPGEWRITIDVEGIWDYGFGMYWDDVPAATAGSDPNAANAPDEGLPLPTILAASGGIVAATAAAAFLATEFGRWKFLGMLGGLGLFSRLEKDEVLAHEKREEVYQYIKNNPGPSFSDLRRELELSNGTLVHHLRVLESQEFVRSYRDGFRTRFYLRGPKIVPTAYLTRTQQQILDTISSNPGVTQKELSSLLGLPRESVSYHANRLAAQGQLQVRQEGKWRRYFAVGPSKPPAPQPLSP
ncbi:MAG: winged helix-turn-helix transcriptional regulator [Euryarchaeota archaeon]|nr:winged helix-turn-helix transcriptional regulator [Euryarchaeota archaeon]